MKKLKTLFAIIVATFPLITAAQNTYVNKGGKTHYIGKLTIDQLYQDTFKNWQVDPKEIPTIEKEVAKILQDYKIKIFLGTWCGDSKAWVPEFLNAWQQAGLSNDNLELIALHNEDDMYKRSPEGYEVGLNIHRVPTFIFYKDGIEDARIVEKPLNDLATDIKQIALGIPSRPRYRAVSILDEVLANEAIDSLYKRKNYRPLLRKVYSEVSKSSELNTYGYVLKAVGELKKAEFVFYLNRNLFRTNPNTWDSLGEIYLEQEKYEEAKFNYEKVAAMDPENENAIAMLKKIELETKN